MGKKYEIDKSTRIYDDKLHRTLYRIRALRDITLSNNMKVCKGDLGGYVESEDNLSQDGNCWILKEQDDKSVNVVYDNALASGNAVILSGSTLCDRAHATDFALVSATRMSGDAFAGDTAHIFSSDIHDKSVVAENAFVSNAALYGNSRVEGYIKTMDKDKMNMNLQYTLLSNTFLSAQSEIVAQHVDIRDSVIKGAVMVQNTANIYDSKLTKTPPCENQRGYNWLVIGSSDATNETPVEVIGESITAEREGVRFTDNDTFDALKKGNSLGVVFSNNDEPSVLKRNDDGTMDILYPKSLIKNDNIVILPNSYVEQSDDISVRKDILDGRNVCFKKPYSGFDNYVIVNIDLDAEISMESNGTHGYSRTSVSGSRLMKTLYYSSNERNVPERKKPPIVFKGLAEYDLYKDKSLYNLALPDVITDKENSNKSKILITGLDINPKNSSMIKEDDGTYTLTLTSYPDEAVVKHFSNYEFTVNMRTLADRYADYIGERKEYTVTAFVTPDKIEKTSDGNYRITVDDMTLSVDAENVSEVSQMDWKQTYPDSKYSGEGVMVVHLTDNKSYTCYDKYNDPWGFSGENLADKINDETKEFSRQGGKACIRGVDNQCLTFGKNKGVVTVTIPDVINNTDNTLSFSVDAKSVIPSLCSNGLPRPGKVDILLGDKHDNISVKRNEIQIDDDGASVSKKSVQCNAGAFVNKYETYAGIKNKTTVKDMDYGLGYEKSKEQEGPSF